MNGDDPFNPGWNYPPPLPTNDVPHKPVTSPSNTFPDLGAPSAHFLETHNPGLILPGHIPLGSNGTARHLGGAPSRPVVPQPGDEQSRSRQPSASDPRQWNPTADYDKNRTGRGFSCSIPVPQPPPPPANDPPDFAPRPNPNQYCRIPGCPNKAYYNYAEQEQTEYCGQGHELQAISTGLVNTCVMCKGRPRRRGERVCGRTCRERERQAPQIQGLYYGVPVVRHEPRSRG